MSVLEECKLVKVATNWEASNKSLDEAVDVVVDSSGGGSRIQYCLDTIVSIDKCVCLTAARDENNSGNPAEIKFHIKHQYQIASIHILSEARIVELYGAESEYIKTYHASFIDDWEGFSVFKAEVAVPALCSCSLKFVKTRDDSRLWIYGILIVVQQAVESVICGPFNINVINHAMQQSPNSSDKSEKIKKFLNMYARLHKPEQRHISPSSQLLLELFQDKQKSKDSSSLFQNGNVRNKLGDIIDINNASGETVHNNSNVAVPPTQISDISEKRPKLKAVSDIEDIRQYIDNKFQVLEQKILCHMDERFKKIEEVQDYKFKQIIRLLENMNVRNQT